MSIQQHEGSIIVKKSNIPGKTLAVFAGVHGNETAGVLALKKVVKKIKPERGCVYFVFAHPLAIKKNVRQIEKNLNRCFLPENKGKTIEDRRARRLMKILDRCDALLDLHASNTKNSTPFIICEKNAFDLARKMNFGIVSSGWDAVEPGATDGYMLQNHKVALCLECGSVHSHRSNVVLAEKSIYQFLQYFGCIRKRVPYSSRKQRLIQVDRAVHKKTDGFSFAKTFDDFHILKPGEMIACDGRKQYIATNNQILIFPNPNKNIGEEVFILGRECSMPGLSKKAE